MVKNGIPGCSKYITETSDVYFRHNHSIMPGPNVITLFTGKQIILLTIAENFHKLARTNHFYFFIYQCYMYFKNIFWGEAPTFSRKIILLTYEFVDMFYFESLLVIASITVLLCNLHWVSF